MCLRYFLDGNAEASNLRPILPSLPPSLPEQSNWTCDLCLVENLSTDEGMLNRIKIVFILIL